MKKELEPGLKVIAIPSGFSLGSCHWLIQNQTKKFLYLGPASSQSQHLPVTVPLAQLLEDVDLVYDGSNLFPSLMEESECVGTFQDLKTQIGNPSLIQVLPIKN